MDDWLVWLGLVLLLIVIAAAVWFLLRKPTGADSATGAPGRRDDARYTDDTRRADDTRYPDDTVHDQPQRLAGEPGPATAAPEPGAGEAVVPGMSAAETGHGAPGAGTAGVVGAGAGDSSAGHGSPGAGTADIAQGEGYGAPGGDTATRSGAGSAGPEGAATAAPGYGGAADAPYDQTADERGYAGTSDRAAYAAGEAPVDEAATGEHWAPPGADVPGSAPGEPADGSYEATTDQPHDRTTEWSNDAPPEAYPGGGTTTTDETGAATAWDEGATTEPAGAEAPVMEPEDERRWDDTHAGGTGAGAAAGGAALGGAAAGAAYADRADETDQGWASTEESEPHPADDTMTTTADEPTAEHAGAAYDGPMDDTAATSGSTGTEEHVGLAPEGAPSSDAAAAGAAGAAAATDQPRYEQDTLMGGEQAAGTGDAGDYGYDEAHYGATSSGGFAPGEYGPGSATPAEDGSGPAGWTVKGNAGSMLFHTPDSPSYNETRAEVWFESEDAARAAGFAHWDRKQR